MIFWGAITKECGVHCMLPALEENKHNHMACGRIFFFYASAGTPEVEFCFSQLIAKLSKPLPMGTSRMLEILSSKMVPSLV